MNASIGRNPSFLKNLKKNILILSILAGLSILIYGNSLDNSFHFDDMHYVVLNPYIRDTQNIPSFFKSPRYGSSVKDFTSHYRPLVVTSYALNYAAGELNPIGYHLVNLAFHVGAAFLVYLIVRTMVAGGSLVFPALAASLIFALHPFNSEVVNYVTARSSVMCAFFYLLAFWCWMKYRDRGSGHPVSFYLAALLSFLVAILSKEIAVTLPVMLWLYDRFFYKSPDQRSRLAGLTLPYLPFVLLVAIPYLLIRKMYYGIMITEWSPERFLSNLATQPLVLTEYLRLLFFSTGLTIDHGITRSQGFGEPAVILSTFLLVALLTLTYPLYRQGGAWRIGAFFILWFFIAFLPTTLIPLNALLQENRGYLAGVGFAVFAGIGLAQLGRGRWRAVSWIFLASLLIVYSLATFQRNQVWENDVTLWSDAVQKTPYNPRALDNLGLAFYRAGNLKKAEIAYLRTLQVSPDYAYAYYNLGLLYKKKERWTSAEIAFQRAAQLNPNHYNTFIHLGMLYQKMGRLKEATAAFERAVAIDSRNSSTFLILGDLFLEMQETKKAAEAYRKALEIDPGHEKAQKQLSAIGDPNVEK